MLLRWGISKAEELHLPMWLDAFPFARELYTRYGFHLVDGELDPRPKRPKDADDGWKRMEQQFSDLRFWPMWRPADGPSQFLVQSSDRCHSQHPDALKTP